ncbi:MAG: hypothetical protein PGN07_01640 [Aeromicrobium erythreum]
MRLKTTAAGLVLALSATLTLSACNDSDDKASGQGSSQSTGGGSGTLTQASFFSDLSAAQKKASTTHVTMKIKAAGQDLSGEGDVKAGSSPKDTAMSMSLDLGSQKGEMRLVDEVFYMNFGSLTGNKFAKIDLNDSSNPFAQQYRSIVKNVDPSAQLGQLEKAVTKFEQKGAATTIDGTKATPYEVTVDTAKLGEALGAPGATTGVPKQLVYTIYIGEDKLPRRVQATVSGTSISMDYSKWGEPVDIAAPPASQVTEKSPFAGMPSAGA